MESQSIQVSEHFAFFSPLPLKALCEAVRARLGLPEFDGSEDATEWGISEDDGLEYNISRPFADGTLQAWDRSVPAGCNVGLALSVSRTHSKWTDGGCISEDFVLSVAQAVANLLGVPVHHHRTWLGPGRNIHHRHVFEPKTGGER